jgi:hypothetical protein
MDRVHYHDLAPWDPSADGLGAVLQRMVVSDYGNDPTNWLATAPNPGAAVIGGTLPVITSQPVDNTVVAGRNTNVFSVTASGATRYLWWANGTNVPGATIATLVLSNIQPTQAGDYYAIALNGTGLIFSSNAHLTVLAPVTFTTQPANQNVLPGTNVTLVAAAVGTGGSGPVRYQWQFEGVNIPDATNATYSFTNANLNQHHGNFRVVATDDLSVTPSANAFIYVLVKPAFLVQPVSQAVLQGGTVTFSGVATGAPPIWYRFIRQGAPTGPTNMTGVLTLTNVQPLSPNQLVSSIRIQATNLASGASGVASATGVNLTVLLDFDRDGMADWWETNYPGFATNNAADALFDFDGDGMINRDEYVAGTNPTDALSVLKLALTITNAGLMQFVAQSNISYSVQYRTDLLSNQWNRVTNITAQSGVRTVEVNAPNPPPDPSRFYRVVTPQLP